MKTNSLFILRKYKLMKPNNIVEAIKEMPIDDINLIYDALKTRVYDALKAREAAIHETRTTDWVICRECIKDVKTNGHSVNKGFKIYHTGGIILCLVCWPHYICIAQVGWRKRGYEMLPVLTSYNAVQIWYLPVAVFLFLMNLQDLSFKWLQDTKRERESLTSMLSQCFMR